MRLDPLKSSPDLRLLRLARCINLTSVCTTSDMGGRNSGSGCAIHQQIPICVIHSKKSQNEIKTKPATKFTIFIFLHPLMGGSCMTNSAGKMFVTCTHKAIISANRDRDFAG
jgi:hypothetical protein